MDAKQAKAELQAFLREAKGRRWTDEEAAWVEERAPFVAVDVQRFVGGAMRIVAERFRGVDKAVAALEKRLKKLEAKK